MDDLFYVVFLIFQMFYYLKKKYMSTSDQQTAILNLEIRDK